ncbi:MULTISPECIES: acyltransferase family protein [Delftia]|uniref:acyltransferase family protein n=1 Tax=Delftia TaxID=80865 RepID=UPI0008E18C72|nr:MULTISPECIES: acyltransferase [Delftia]MPT53919.1 acyltransferase [Delftia sp.]SFB62240.1 Peptidoglycan/LPS O-acetylase OafA/YrhL, contains acyltransferase and SGNH-hydrolase domains [Delftia tsuruhatensis]
MTASTPNLHRPVSHTNNFDAIRIVAALAVLVSHHHALIGQFEPLVLGIHSLGGFAVLVFFVVSGYLVTCSWNNDPHLVRFTLRRALRIWPALIAVVVLTTYGLGVWLTTLAPKEYLQDSATSGYLSNIWLHGKAGLPGLFENNPLRGAANGSIWTIPYEVQCYVILACAGLLGALRIRTVWLLMVLVTTIWYQVKYGPDFHPDWKLKREMMVYFILGSALAVLQPSWSRRPLPWLAALTVASLCAWFFGLRYLSLMIALPYLLIYLGTQSTPILRQFGRWGDPSYGLYLIAFPIQQTVIHFFWPTIGSASVLALSVAITTVLAYASWHGIEKRALKIKPRKP